MYCIYKLTLEPELYLISSVFDIYKKDIVCIRMGGVDLAVDEDRYMGLNIWDRICTLHNRREIENNL